MKRCNQKKFNLPKMDAKMVAKIKQNALNMKGNSVTNKIASKVLEGLTTSDYQDIISNVQKKNIPQSVIDAKSNVVATKIDDTQYLTYFKVFIYEAKINLESWQIFLREHTNTFIACRLLTPTPVPITLKNIEFFNSNINQSANLKNIHATVITEFDEAIVEIPGICDEHYDNFPIFPQKLYIIQFDYTSGHAPGRFNDTAFVIQSGEMVAPNNLSKDKRMSIKFSSWLSVKFDKNLNSILIIDNDDILSPKKYDLLRIETKSHTLLNYSGCFLEFEDFPITVLEIPLRAPYVPPESLYTLIYDTDIFDKNLYYSYQSGPTPETAIEGLCGRIATYQPLGPRGQRHTNDGVGIGIPWTGEVINNIYTYNLYIPNQNGSEVMRNFSIELSLVFEENIPDDFIITALEEKTDKFGVGVTIEFSFKIEEIWIGFNVHRGPGDQWFYNNFGQQPRTPQTKGIFSQSTNVIFNIPLEDNAFNISFPFILINVPSYLKDIDMTSPQYKPSAKDKIAWPGSSRFGGWVVSPDDRHSIDSEKAQYFPQTWAMGDLLSNDATFYKSSDDNKVINFMFNSLLYQDGVDSGNVDKSIMTITLNYLNNDEGRDVYLGWSIPNDKKTNSKRNKSCAGAIKSMFISRMKISKDATFRVLVKSSTYPSGSKILLAKFGSLTEAVSDKVGEKEEQKLSIVPLVPLYNNEKTQTSLNPNVYCYAPYFDKKINDWFDIVNYINTFSPGENREFIRNYDFFDTTIVNGLALKYHTQFFYWAWYYTFAGNHNFSFSCLLKHHDILWWTSYENRLYDSYDNLIQYDSLPVTVIFKPRAPAVYLTEAFRSLTSSAKSVSNGTELMFQEYLKVNYRESDSDYTRNVVKNTNVAINYTLFNGFSEEIGWNRLPNGGNINYNGIYSIFNLQLQDYHLQPTYDNLGSYHPDPIPDPPLEGSYIHNLDGTFAAPSNSLRNYNNSALVVTTDGVTPSRVKNSAAWPWSIGIKPSGPLSVSVSSVGTGTADNPRTLGFPEVISQAPLTVMNFNNKDFYQPINDNRITYRNQFYGIGSDYYYFKVAPFDAYIYDFRWGSTKTIEKIPGLLTFKARRTTDDFNYVRNISNNTLYNKNYTNEIKVLPIPNPIPDMTKYYLQNKFDLGILNNLFIFPEDNLKKWPQDKFIDKRSLQRYFRNSNNIYEFLIKIPPSYYIDSNGIPIVIPVFRTLKKLTIRGLYGSNAKISFENSEGATVLTLDHYTDGGFDLFDTEDDTNTLTEFYIINDN